MDARAATDVCGSKRTAKSCGSDVAVLALRSARSEASPDNGGKRAVLREEHEVSRKAIAQGRPECSRCPVCSCAVLFAQIARETAGAASTRSSLRPLISRGQTKMQTSGAIASRERETRIHVMCEAERSESIDSALEPRTAATGSLPRGTMTRRRGRGPALRRARRTGREPLIRAMEPGPEPRNRPVCLDFRQPDFPLVT